MQLLGRLIAGVVGTAGGLIGAVAAVVGAGFVQSLILVVVGAGVTGLFGLLVAYVQIRENRRLHERLDKLEDRAKDIAANTSTDRRESDPTPAEVE